MRADLAPLAIAVVFLFAGFGVLSGVGMLAGRALNLLAATGAAYMTGLISVLMVGNVLLVIGVGISVPVFVLLGLIVGACGYAVAARRRSFRPSRLLAPGWKRPAVDAGHWSANAVWGWTKRRAFVLIAGIAFLAIAVWGYRWAQVTPLFQWDSWSIWARKGMILFWYGTPKLEFFANPYYAFMHPDYPLLLPLLESVWFRFAGSADTAGMGIQFWLFLIAAMGAAAYFASRFSRAKIWIPVVGFIAFVPAVSGQLMTMYADVPMGLLLMIGVLLLGNWVVDRRHSHLIVGMLFLAATANTKDEGFTYAVVTVVVAFLCVAVKREPGRSRRADLKTFLLGAAGFLVLILPWRIWVAVNHIPSSDVSLGKGLNPGHIVSNLHRIGPSLTAIYHQIANQSTWSWLLPLSIALTLSCLVARRLTRLASYYALTGLGVFVMILWAYVVGKEPIGWWLTNSVDRTVDGVMFVAAAALLGLTGAVLGRPAGSDDTSMQRAPEDDAPLLQTAQREPSLTLT